MSWKPTEGMKRGESLIRQLALDAPVCGAWLDDNIVFRYRMLELIAKEINQALADGAEQDAINAVVGKDDLVLHDEAFSPNGIAETAGRIAVRLTPQERADVDASVRANGGEPQEIDYIVAARQKLQQHAMGVPPTADPVGLDMPDFPAGPTIVVGDDRVVGPAGVTATIAEQLKHIDKTEPKKRGRPKGSTNKAKKKARAAKNAGTSLTDIPNAAPEAEPQAGGAAS